MLLTLRTKSYHCDSLSVPVQRTPRQQQSIHTPLPAGKRTPAASLGPCLWDHRITDFFRPEKPPKPTCSLPVSAWTGSGRERHQAETPSYAQGGFPDHGRIGNAPGHSNNGSENSESMVRHTGHSAQRSLPEILVKIPDSREQHILSSEPTLMGKQSH